MSAVYIVVYIDIWHIVHFVIFWCVFLPSWKITLLAIKNGSPPAVFDLGGWNGHHFVLNWVAETATYHFLNIWSLSSKNMKHKRRNMQKICFFGKQNFYSSKNMKRKGRNMQKIAFLKKKNSFASQMFIIEKFEKTVGQAVRLVMVNEIKSSNLFYL